MSYRADNSPRAEHLGSHLGKVQVAKLGDESDVVDQMRNGYGNISGREGRASSRETISGCSSRMGLAPTVVRYSLRTSAESVFFTPFQALVVIV